MSKGEAISDVMPLGRSCDNCEHQVTCFLLIEIKFVAQMINRKVQRLDDNHSAWFFAGLATICMAFSEKLEEKV